jgi:hypothetical protein
VSTGADVRNPPVGRSDAPDTSTTSGAPGGFAVPVGRVLAGLALAALVPALLGSTGWGRRQLALSFTRLPDRSVELFFTDPHAGRACTPGRITADFTLINHDGSRRSLGYTVALSAPGVPTATSHGTVTLSAGGRQRLRVDLSPRPVGRYSVHVVLDDLRQQINLTCGRQGAS